LERPAAARQRVSTLSPIAEKQSSDSLATEVPQFLLEANIHGSKKIAVTQPRRVAATSLATRVAKEQGTTLGSLVGYAVRFDEKHSPETRIKYMTDGMIMRELLSDPTLSNYNVIIVDEAHERTLRTDMLLSSLKAIQKSRNSAVNGVTSESNVVTHPLKVIVMSATLDAERFSKFFNK
jgi:ATP-dependent RNA helicase DHX33